MLRGFREFVFKGNVIDMAVGVVVGVAFGNFVQAIVKGLITPLIGAFGGLPDFAGLSFSVNGSPFRIGEVINALITFLSVAVVVYFGVIVPMGKITKRMNSGKTEDPTEKACPECLSLIPLAAKRCKFCTSIVGKK